MKDTSCVCVCDASPLLQAFLMRIIFLCCLFWLCAQVSVETQHVISTLFRRLLIVLGLKNGNISILRPALNRQKSTKCASKEYLTYHVISIPMKKWICFCTFVSVKRQAASFSYSRLIDDRLEPITARILWYF